jgi:hypothetical protein
MKTRTYTLIDRLHTSVVPLTLLSCLIAAPIPGADDTATKVSAQAHAGHGRAVPAKLVQLVRDVTRQFTDVNAATAAGYQPFLGCVTGPDHGAMGVHYVNGPLVGDGLIDASKPEVLIYEPSGEGMKLVGVEYLVDAATWLQSHSGAPVLEGQVFQLVNSPNRYGLPAHFELHVWAWRDNPSGAFVDWNNRVSCESQ